MIGALNHVGVATPSIADSIKLYRDVLGATKIGEPFDLPAQGVKVCFIDTPTAQIELIEPYDETSPIVGFLAKADRHHGVFPHFLNGTTGKTIAFSEFDDGGDVVETAFLMMGLLCARQYFDHNTAAETTLRAPLSSAVVRASLGNNLNPTLGQAVSLAAASDVTRTTATLSPQVSSR